MGEKRQQRRGPLESGGHRDTEEDDGEGIKRYEGKQSFQKKAMSEVARGDWWDNVETAACVPGWDLC